VEAKLSTKRILWSLLEAKERAALFWLFTLMLIGTCFEALSVGMLIPVLAVLSSDSEMNLPFGITNSDMQRTTLIWVVTSIVFFIYVTKNLFLALSVWIQRGFLTRLTARIASKMLNVYLRQPYKFHLEKNSSTLIRNTQDASVIVSGGIEPFLTIISETLIAITLLIVLIAVEVRGTLIVVGTLFLATMIFHRVSGKKLQTWGKSRQNEKGKIIQTIQQGLGAIKDIQVLNREGWFAEEHSRHQVRDARLLRRIVTIQALPRLWLEIMAIGGLTGLVGVMLGLGREVDAIIPVVGVFAATAFRVLPSINKIVGCKQTLQVARSTLETIHSDLSLDVVNIVMPNSEILVFNEVNVQQLYFSYQRKINPVLVDVNIRIKRGEAVGFVGQSGSGKSTLIDIMLGLLEPQSGSVLINGQLIEDVKQSWQKTIGYIPQTIFLMDDSLRRNIAIGIADNEIDEIAVQDALKSAQLEDFVASLPDGLDTVVGERGVRLSGGQRQRIGIARALYHRPSVLVLDEATSSLDTETEKGVMQAVQALQGDKTVIIVAHRLSTVEYCDRLYRLDAGRIVDEGTFDEVMNRSQS